MSLEEIIEKAFKSGAEFIIENFHCCGGETEFSITESDYPDQNEINLACMEYINGNLKSSKS